MKTSDWLDEVLHVPSEPMGWRGEMGMIASAGAKISFSVIGIMIGAMVLFLALISMFYRWLPPPIAGGSGGANAPVGRLPHRATGGGQPHGSPRTLPESRIEGTPPPSHRRGSAARPFPHGPPVRRPGERRAVGPAGNVGRWEREAAGAGRDVR